jgi:hypothetical protein
MISKQKRKLIHKLSFYLLMNATEGNQIKEDIKQSKEIIKSCKNYTNKRIKEIIEIQEANYYLPF